jgi:hypothetical protein
LVIPRLFEREPNLPFRDTHFLLNFPALLRRQYFEFHTLQFSIEWIGAVDRAYAARVIAARI